MRWSFYLLLLLVLLDVGYLASIWPDWQVYQQGPIQRSTFIHDYQIAQLDNPGWPKLGWNPVALKRIPQNMVRAVIVAEDSRFYSHSGVDWEALEDAMHYNLDRGRLVYGGSTISQQTAKNLFLSPSRNPLRKWHELVLTLAARTGVDAGHGTLPEQATHHGILSERRTIRPRPVWSRRSCTSLLGYSCQPPVETTGYRARGILAIACNHQSGSAHQDFPESRQ